jgi:hypothetical protein
VPRDITEDLKAHLAGETTTLAACWKIVRTDGETLGFTNHDDTITYDGVDYLPFTSADLSNLEQLGGTSTGNMEMGIAFDDSYITRSDVEKGLYDFADIYVFLINYADPSMGIVKLLSGQLGEAQMDEYNATIEMTSLIDHLQNRIGRMYGYKCDAEFGDDRCAIGWRIIEVDLGTNMIAVSGYVGASIPDAVKIVNSTGNDGTYTVVTVSYNSEDDQTEIILDEALSDATADGRIDGKEPLKETGTVTAYSSRSVFTDSSRAEADDYWKYGVVTFTSGSNEGFSREVKSFASGVFTLFMPLPYDIAVDDAYTVYPGCDKYFTTCQAYDNQLNFQGFPHLPGRDEVSKYADLVR